GARVDRPRDRVRHQRRSRKIPAPVLRRGLGARDRRGQRRLLLFPRARAAPVIEDAEIAEVVATMKSGWLGSGPKVAQFEADCRKYKGADHAAALYSCTAALHLSILAAGL